MEVGNSKCKTQRLTQYVLSLCLIKKKFPSLLNTKGKKFLCDFEVCINTYLPETGGSVI